MKKVRLAACLWALAPVVFAQSEADSRRVELDKQASKLLLGFGRQAEAQKFPSRAREAYQMILDHYDDEQALARKRLGFKKVDGAWELDSRFEPDADTGDVARRLRVDKAWGKLCDKVGALHREFAQALDAEGHRARAVAQFERAVSFLPRDEVSQKALGHVEFDGFWGTETQVAVARRMCEIQAFAKELRGRDYEVEDLPPESLPESLQRSGLTFHGVKSEHFVHYYTGTREGAHDGVKWAERAWDLLGFMLQGDAGRRVPDSRKWFARLRNEDEKMQLLANVPESRDGQPIEICKLFSGNSWKEGGAWVGFSVMWYENEADTVVGHVANRHMPDVNNAFEEGMVHVCTWLLCGTTQATYIGLPKTIAADFEPLGNDPDEWMKRLQDQIARGASWPLAQLPRERRDNFRPDARLKAWSFLAFLIARYPDRWHRMVSSLGEAEKLTLEDSEARFREATGRTVAELESEWREWARRGSRWGRASGWH